ncbi:MAG: hypothetical protein WDN48_01595 [Pseudolabrys sp.]
MLKLWLDAVTEIDLRDRKGMAVRSMDRQILCRTRISASCICAAHRGHLCFA